MIGLSPVLQHTYILNPGPMNLVKLSICAALSQGKHCGLIPLVSFESALAKILMGSTTISFYWYHMSLSIQRHYSSLCSEGHLWLLRSKPSRKPKKPKKTKEAGWEQAKTIEKTKKNQKNQRSQPEWPADAWPGLRPDSSPSCLRSLFFLVFWGFLNGFVMLWRHCFSFSRFFWFFRRMPGARLAGTVLAKWTLALSLLSWSMLRVYHCMASGWCA